MIVAFSVNDESMERIRYLFLLLVALASSSPSQSTQHHDGGDDADELKDLYLLLLAPFNSPQHVYDEGPALVPAVDVALDIINNRTDVLPGYRLRYIVADSACTDGTTAIVNFARTTFHGDRDVVGVVGPACSGAAFAIAPVLAHSEVELLQVTIATSPLLTDGKNRNTYFALSTALVYVRLFTELMEREKWTTVGAFYETKRLYVRSVFDAFQKSIPSQYELKFFADIDNFDFPVTEAIRNQVRVLFVFAGKVFSQRLLCAAYHEDILYPRHQWVFHDKRESHFKGINFTTGNGRVYSCDQEQMNQAMNGAIFARYSIDRDCSDPTKFIGDMNYCEYRKRYNESVPNGTDFNEYSNGYYDATWALALSLNNSISWFKANNKSLSNYNYTQLEATKAVRQELLGLDFTGITGIIHFSSTREADTRLDLYQMKQTVDDNGSDIYVEENIGLYNGSLHVHENSNFIKSSFNRVNGFTDKPIFMVAGVVLIVVMALLAVINAVLLILSFTFRDNPAIKASSPRLNVLIFSGCCLFQIGMIVIIVRRIFLGGELNFSPLVHSILCVSPWWCFGMGYTLVFGTLCGRTWRVYRIFMFFQKEFRFISDQSIILFVIAILFFDVLVLTVINVVSPCSLGIQDSHFDGSETIIVNVGPLCKEPMAVFILIGIMAVNKGLLLLALFFLAVLTRNIKRTAFRSTLENNPMIAFCIILSNGIGLPLILFLRHSIIELISEIIVFSMPVPLCQAFLFLPPLISALKRYLRLRNSKENLQLQFRNDVFR